MQESFTDFITFNPGPSRISPRICKAIHEVVDSGFLSLSHRSDAFKEVSKKAVEGLREKMGLPADYKIFYQPSATTAMETILRNLVRKKSVHFVHGAFSRLFYSTAAEIGLEPQIHESPMQEAVDWRSASLPKNAELIAVTHCETSSGLIWPKEELSLLRKEHPGPLLAIDATSTFGTMRMRWEEADLWFLAVQKCLGLPSGLGILLVGPRALERAIRGAQAAPWQRFDALLKKMESYCTPETPNMLNIALLARQMEQWDLDRIEKETEEKAQFLYASLPWKPFVEEAGWRSPTLLNFKVKEPALWHQRAAENKLILGMGYPPLENSCIRIANFPAHSLDDFRRAVKLFIEP